MSKASETLTREVERAAIRYRNRLQRKTKARLAERVLQADWAVACREYCRSTLGLFPEGDEA